jgi:hypothetical protein
LIVLCRFHVGTGIPGVAPHYTPSPTTFTWSSSSTGSITLVSYRGKTRCCTHHTFLLGFPTDVCFTITSIVQIGEDDLEWRLWQGNRAAKIACGVRLHIARVRWRMDRPGSGAELILHWPSFSNDFLIMKQRSVRSIYFRTPPFITQIIMFTSTPSGSSWTQTCRPRSLWLIRQRDTHLFRTRPMRLIYWDERTKHAVRASERSMVMKKTHYSHPNPSTPIAMHGFYFNATSYFRMNQWVPPLRYFY